MVSGLTKSDEVKTTRFSFILQNKKQKHEVQKFLNFTLVIVLIFNVSRLNVKKVVSCAFLKYRLNQPVLR